MAISSVESESSLRRNGLREIAVPHELASLGIDFTNPLNDGITLGIIRGAMLLETRIAATRFLGQTLFETRPGQVLDAKRAGDFLRTAVAISQDEKADEELKQELSRILDRETLLRIRHESAVLRWEGESLDSAAKGFTEFMTINKYCGNDTKGAAKAAEIKLRIARHMIFSTETDNQLEVAQTSMGVPSIFLAIEGNQVAAALKEGLDIAATEEVGVKYPRIDPYYRSAVWVVEEDKEAEMNGRQTYRQRGAEMFQREGAPAGTGVDLGIFGPTYDQDGELAVVHNTAFVGGHLMTGVGHGFGLRQTAIENAGVIHDEPQTIDKYRNIQLEKTNFNVVIFGDGADGDLDAAFKYSEIFRSATVLVCEDNGRQIGVPSGQTNSKGAIAQAGVRHGRPAVSIEDPTDYEKMFAAGLFAGYQAAKDGGSTLVHLKTVRGGSHSSAHGNTAVEEIIREVRETFSKQFAAGFEDPASDAIQTFLNKDRRDGGIYGPTNTDTIFDVRGRLLEFGSKTPLHESTVEQLQGIVDKIINPMQVVLAKMVEEGVLTKAQITELRQKFRKFAQDTLDEVRDAEQAKPDIVGKYVRHGLPEIIIKGKTNQSRDPNELVYEAPYYDKLITADGATALSTAQKDMAGVRGFHSFGIDFDMGYEITEGVHVPKGSYQKETSGVRQENGHFPGVQGNLPIAELRNQEWANGAADQPAWKRGADFKRVVALLEGKWDYPQTEANTIRRIALFLAYIDYAKNAAAAWGRDGGRVQWTSGQDAMPAFTFAHSGMAPGGNPWHGHSGEMDGYAAPQGMDFITVSNPKSLYEVARTLFHFGVDPALVLWPKGIWNKPKTWIEGTGFWDGRDVWDKKGGDGLVVASGPAVPIAEQAVAQVERDTGAKISIVDKMVWRKTGKEEDILEQALKATKGRIVMVTEAFRSQSLNMMLIGLMQTSRRLSMLVEGRLPTPDEFLGSVDTSASYTSPILTEAHRPGNNHVVNALTQAIRRERLKELESSRGLTVPREVLYSLANEQHFFTS